ncbi:MAG: hydrogenase maturation nickel metallochaperone HypA [Firmicutes bacterium]|nr:hydrogenase maturation nickel metallochaperone HypA [Bacillota bacterium]
MHEYSLARRIAETAAQYANGAKVNSVSLLVGEDSGVLAESVKLYFDLIAAGTVCENAKIEIETVKPMLRCKACGALFARKPFSFACPCGGEGLPTDIGREFYIKSIEVET